MLTTNSLLRASRFACSSIFQTMSSRSSSSSNYRFETLAVKHNDNLVVHVELNRPDKLNAMNSIFWRDMIACFELLAQDENCRAIVLSGRGKHFSAGLDLVDAMSMFSAEQQPEVGRRAMAIRRMAQPIQNSISVVERCCKPVIAAVHGACIGGGVDLITACDIRYCSEDAYFQVKEVDLGLAADIGTLQRLPRVIGSDSLARELVYTGRQMDASEAVACGLVSRVLPSADAVCSAALQLADVIASKSPIAVQGSKVALVYARDHSVADGLEQVLTWNQAALQSEDVIRAAMASINKEKATFAKL